MKFKIGLLAILIVLMASCCTTKKTETNKKIALETWQLTTMQGQTFEAEQTPVLVLNAQTMQFSGNNGCSSIVGDLTTYNATELQFGKIDHTRISCGNMDAPYQYENLLKKVRFYTINDRSLLLKDANKTTLLTFSKKE